MRTKSSSVILSLLIFLMPMSGCFGDSSNEDVGVTSGFFDFDQDIGNRTWFHYPGGLEAENNTSPLGGSNVPFFTTGTYYSIGMSTFEPTMGITSAENLYISSWGNGPAGSTAIVQCSNLIEMRNLSDYSCVNVYDPLIPIPNSNDP